ncbi:hypothetical protein AYM02_03865 [Coxiella burnetii]|nr:hypothetical protein [Coxiella burnetii]AML48487.1 hypothetical protein AUR58_04305 [Coxiella burnetii]AML54489.1 hypothetical protein AYM38_03820 [Coxiella burnetii]ATN68451.1 hypothetical protein AYM00_03995 [Coxiella burnetii]ATN70380.1 hypothetical protein AYM02_03865 [Coxiella burnetii]ATN72317.1 hypothetical protein AYM11_03730 [Coxiella burnetii]
MSFFPFDLWWHWFLDFLKKHFFHFISSLVSI